MNFKALILETLDDMLADDLARFKFCLSSDVPAGFNPIGKGKLENKSRVEIVNQLFTSYLEKDAVKVALHALRKAELNQPAQELEKKIAIGAMGTSETPHPQPGGQGQSAGSSIATPPSAPQVSIQCDSGKVQAPVITQATFEKEVTMNFN
ncbi:hypothetical protein GJAV_G00220690 [Gymnothorax javanicus]|nr:hypothetical protein GJAV_G00220690 [Gymnothorax javanicus]